LEETAPDETLKGSEGGEYERERIIPSERPPLLNEFSANFLRIEGCHVVSVRNPYGCVLGILDRSRYFSIK
jgi:hypothetical protein